jgi:hypothetical protein
MQPLAMFACSDLIRDGNGSRDRGIHDAGGDLPRGSRGDRDCLVAHRALAPVPPYQRNREHEEDGQSDRAEPADLLRRHDIEHVAKMVSYTCCLRGWLLAADCRRSPVRPARTGSNPGLAAPLSVLLTLSAPKKLAPKPYAADSQGGRNAGSDYRGWRTVVAVAR